MGLGMGQLYILLKGNRKFPARVAGGRCVLIRNRLD